MRTYWWNNLRTSTALITGALLLSVGLGCGYVLGERSSYGGVISDASQPQGVDFSPVWKTWHAIDDRFVPVAVASSTPVATSSSPDAIQERVWGMAAGLTASLNDPYSYFLPPSENKSFNDDMSGAFEGVGMQIDKKNMLLTVVSPIKGTPAEKAGIRSGDIILKIDGIDTSDMEVSDAVKRIRGPKGTQVTLLLKRESWTSAREIKVTRDVINVPEVTATAKPDGVFVISVITFTANSPDLFRNALRQFIESGDTKLVLDLRGNPGGYLDAAVDMASWFLPSGKPIVSEDYKGNSANIVHRSFGYDVFNKNLKMVILTDHGTASAAEILSNALSQYHIGTTVGTNTFGKGSVQELIPITSDTSLKLTVARWLGPNGEPIPKTGIAPDVQVELTDADLAAGRDPQMAKALDILSGK